MKSKVLVIFLFLHFSLFSNTITGNVTAVYDGDTITILDDSKTQHKIRFEHIDTPEKKQAFGEKAKKYLSSMIFGKNVKVVIKEKDRYGRNIGTVYLDEKNINLAMVQAGFAWHYKFYSKDEAFSKAEVEAKKKKAGLWINPKPIPPWEFRKNKR